MDNLYFNSLEEYSIDKKEYCFLKESSNKYSETFKVYIPKLMPLFNMKDVTKEWRESFDPNIFVNDNKCKPNVKNFVMLQNFLTIRRKRNSWFKFHPNTFDKGTRLLCEIPEKNIRHIRLLDEEFSVETVDKKSPSFVRNSLYEILDIVKTGDKIKFVYNDSVVESSVLSITEWCVTVNYAGTVHRIPAYNIVGVSKPAEYYSYYEDSFKGV